MKFTNVNMYNSVISIIMKRFFLLLILMTTSAINIIAQSLTDSLDIDITYENVSIPYRKYYQEHCSVTQREKFRKLADSLEGRFVHIQIPQDGGEQISGRKIYYDNWKKETFTHLGELQNQYYCIVSVSAFKVRCEDGRLLLRPIIKANRIDVDDDHTIYGFPITREILNCFNLDMTIVKQEKMKSETEWPIKGDYYYSKVSNGSKRLGIKYKVVDCIDYDRLKGLKKIILSSKMYNDSIVILKSPIQFYKGFMALRYWKIFRNDCINKLEQRNEELRQLYKGKYVFACSSYDSINIKVVDLQGKEINKALSVNKNIFTRFNDLLKEGHKAQVDNVLLRSNYKNWGYEISCIFTFYFVTQNVIDKKYRIKIECDEALCKKILTPWQWYQDKINSYKRGKKEADDFFVRMADKYGYDYEPQYSRKNNNRKVYVAEESYAYHRTKACRTLRRSSWIGTLSISEAKRNNLRPCKVCW